MERVPQKDRFTSLDTLALVRELAGLRRARIDKAFDDPEHEGFLLTLRSPGEGRRALRIVPGRYGALLSGVTDRGEELSPFARELRRLLSGGVVASIAEPGGERYLELEVRRGDQNEPLRLAVELFGKGNVVVARGDTIAAVATPRAWAHRTQRVGAAYQRPPIRGNPWELKGAELSQALIASRTDRVSTLAARLAFGGPVAEELLARAGLSGTAPSAEAPAASAEALLSAVRELLQEVGERPRGFLYQAGGLLLDVEPYAARRFAGESDIEVLELPTFSEAADRYFPEIRPRVVAPTTEELGRRERMRQREQQLAAIARLEAEVEAWRREADAILAQYPTAEAALEKAASGAAGSEASVEVDLDGVRVRLERGRSARESAQARYEEMKRCQSKLEGARAALEGTDRELAVRAPSASVRPRTERPARRHFWFEQYRWFLSSEAVVVIAGRDAASNDRIVKRYLGDTDRYVHADIHGAASVVVKHPPPGAPPMTELTLREACQWGLAYSKAWRAGRASGDAYWVEAEQVSKAAGSGEFVGRGAWVIHGTKHFFHDLPMELGIGVYRYENEELWGVAPPEALRARGELRAVLSPGEERARPEVEVALAREMGLSRGVLQPMLPAGGLTYRRA